ncbi:MAG: hypothetical protein ACE5GO_02950 [Anaerolineales bacterium]
MNITPDEAQQSLSAIQQVTTQTRRAVAHGGGPYFMFIWGGVWFLGFLTSHFLASAALLGGIWTTLSGLGMVATFLTGARLGRRVHGPLGARIGLFWLALTGYGVLWVWLTRPTSGEQMSMMIVTIAMFGYVVMGLWLGGIFAWVGLGTTALALLGYFLFPTYFNLWMAFLGGGALVGSGVYILRRWR